MKTPILGTDFLTFFNLAMNIDTKTLIEKETRPKIHTELVLLIIYLENLEMKGRITRPDMETVFSSRTNDRFGGV